PLDLPISREPSWVKGHGTALLIADVFLSSRVFVLRNIEFDPFITSALNPHILALPLREAATVRVPIAPGQLNGFFKIHPHFFRRMRVGSKRNHHSALGGELNNIAAGIDFMAVLAQ